MGFWNNGSSDQWAVGPSTLHRTFVGKNQLYCIAWLLWGVPDAFHVLEERPAEQEGRVAGGAGDVEE